MKKILTILFALIFCTGSAFAKDLTMHNTLQINTDSELLLSHEYYKGIKIKSIKIKQIEINHDSYITNGEVLEGDPNSFSIVVEITDMKGNTTELFGHRSLSHGDYTYFVTPEEKE